jgi:chromosome segregation ATPase
MEDIAAKLHKEVQGVAKPYLDQIEELEATARNKRQAVSQLSEESEAKEREIEALKAEAQATLGRCGDPRPLLSKVSSLRSEQEDLQILIANTGQVDQAEQEQIEELKRNLFKVIHEKIGYSKIREQNSKALLDALRQAVKVHDEWDKAIQNVCSDLGIKAKKHRLLHFKDESEETTLTNRIRAFANKHAHLFDAA